MKNKIVRIDYVIGMPSGKTYFYFCRNRNIKGNIRMYSSDRINGIRIHRLVNKATFIDILPMRKTTDISLYFAPRSKNIFDIMDFYAKKHYLDFAKWCLVFGVWNIIFYIALIGAK